MPLLPRGLTSGFRHAPLLRRGFWRQHHSHGRIRQWAMSRRIRRSRHGQSSAENEPLRACHCLSFRLPATRAGHHTGHGEATVDISQPAFQLIWSHAYATPRGHYIRHGHTPAPLLYGCRNNDEIIVIHSHAGHTITTCCRHSRFHAALCQPPLPRKIRHCLIPEIPATPLIRHATKIAATPADTSRYATDAARHMMRPAAAAPCHCRNANHTPPRDHEREHGDHQPPAIVERSGCSGLPHYYAPWPQR